ncbi:MAG: sensor histidine kinase [Burkholderiaceae bacterium]|nr:sensor histidine kinase [Burkholderiaceae bacterium]
MTPARARPSLRARLSRHVLLPLALTWLTGSLIAVEVAQYFTGRAFDRSLLDDAYMVASNVNENEGRLQLDMSQGELDGVLFDQAEAMLLKVQAGDGTLVAGQAELPSQPSDETDLPYQFHDEVVQGRAVRAVTLRRDQPQPFMVVMAQTDRSRSVMLRNVLVYATVPQLLLLTGLALWLRRAIGVDTESLSQLQQTVDRRGEDDLGPIHVDASTSDVAQLGEAINSLLARLSRSLEAQREFAGNVAHELRTPLAGIRALAEYGLAQKDPQVWRAQLERIASSQARASRMVDQLLALALADEVRTGLRLTPVALDAQVQEAVLRFLPRADTAGVDLGARGIDGPVTVQADAMLVEGILNNLLDNALRYGRPAEGAASITVEVSHEGGPDGAVALSVSDNGPGLPPDRREALRQRWAQGEAGASLGHGSGLGLSIVTQYAQLMGARFSLDDVPGGPGLRASVRFVQPTLREGKVQA